MSHHRVSGDLVELDSAESGERHFLDAILDAGDHHGRAGVLGFRKPFILTEEDVGLLD
ncbi:hypothetical protein D9M73_297470 [compost metagenome]